MPEYFESLQDMHHHQVKKPGTEVVIEESGYHLIELLEPLSEVNILGIFSAKDSQKIDVEVVIHHRAPHTRATTTLKGVARGSSRIRFVGRIIIDEKCPNTNSFLTERILLLSDTATAEAVPDLEILSDDVKCSHAASISHIPENQIFYLMSRGISKEDAENLIVDGFLAEKND